MFNWFNNLKVRTKLITAFLIMIGLIAIVSVVAVVSQNNSQAIMSDILDVSVEKADLAMEIDISMLLARRAEKDYLLRYKALGFEEARAKYAAGVQSQVATILGYTAELASLEDQEGITRVKALEQAISEYETSFLETVNLYEKRGYKDTGLEGQFRGKVHELEAAAEEHNLPQLTIDILSLRRQEKDYLLRGDEKYVTRVHEAVAQFKADVDVTELSQSDKDNMSALADDYQATFDQLVLADTQIAAEIEVYREAVHEVEPLVEEIQNAAQENMDLERADMESAAQTTLITLIAVSLVAAVFGLVLAFIIANSIANPIIFVTEGAQRLAIGDAELAGMDTTRFEKINTRKDELGAIGRAFSNLIDYFKEMATAAQSLAGNDLTVDVAPKSDVDLLGNAFSQMIANLRDMINQVAENANSVSAASQQLAAAADQAGQATTQITTVVNQVAKGTAEQSESVNQTAATIEQMSRAIDGVAKGAQEQAGAVSKASNITSEISGAVQQVSGNAEAVSQGSASASEAARSGSKTVEQTIQGMENIREKVGLSADKVQEMGRRSEQIGAIVETIEDIASQTNLLALNAAIEAARAGEHGKGFAVVADEVRKLAERASEATKEIADLIKGIQGTVDEAVDAMDEGAKEVEAGVELANEAGHALADILKASEAVYEQAEKTSEVSQRMSDSTNELVGAVDSVSAVVEENTAATEEMAAGSGEMTQAIENIASVSEQNSAAIEEVSASAEEMSAQVEEVTASAGSLADMAQALQQVVAQFKLEGDGAGGNGTGLGNGKAPAFQSLAQEAFAGDGHRTKAV